MAIGDVQNRLDKQKAEAVKQPAEKEAMLRAQSRKEDLAIAITQPIHAAAPSLPGLPENCRTRRSRGAVRAGQTNVAAAASGVEARNHNPSNGRARNGRSRATLYGHRANAGWSSGKCRERSQCPNSVPMSCSRTPISRRSGRHSPLYRLVRCRPWRGSMLETLGRRINKFPRWQFWPDMLRSAVMPG